MTINSVTKVLAKGGKGGSTAIGGDGGASAAGVGDIKYSGGRGGDTIGIWSPVPGHGGGGAGTTGDGGNAWRDAGSPWDTYAGSGTPEQGGDGGPSSTFLQNHITAYLYGGGGGGTGYTRPPSHPEHSNGANGLVQITYEDTSYAMPGIKWL